MPTLQQKIARQWPTAVYLNLDELGTLSVALGRVDPPKRRDNKRHLASVRNKIERARRRRMRALARAKR